MIDKKLAIARCGSFWVKTIALCIAILWYGLLIKQILIHGKGGAHDTFPLLHLIVFCFAPVTLAYIGLRTVTGVWKREKAIVIVFWLVFVAGPPLLTIGYIILKMRANAASIR
jgi:hypothetical protein